MGIDPATIAAITQFAEVAGGVASVGSAVAGISAERKAAKAQKRANIAAMQEAEKQAGLTREDAADKAREKRLDAKRIRSQQLALYMKSGVSLEGSPMLVGAETAEKGRVSAEAILETGEATAESILLRGQAAQRPVQRADFFGAGQTILGGVQSISKALPKKAKK